MVLIAAKDNVEASGSQPLPERKIITVRIRDIPLDHIPNALKKDIEAILHDQDVDPKIHIEHHSFVPQDDSSICATISINTFLPSSSLLALLRAADACESYIIDDDFLDITPVYESPEGVDVDVIAVSGLGSHPVGSFKSPSRNKVWLRDFLPVDIPRIRVLLYGYRTPLLNNDSKDSIGDLGSRLLESLKAFRGNTSRRPIIFIGYSMGGLLIKEALVTAAKKLDDTENYDLQGACHGMLFFGVPNLGLRQEQFCGIVKGRPNERLIRDLVVDKDSEPTPYLDRLGKDFAHACKGKYKVVSFYERRESPTLEFNEDGSLSRTGPPALLVTEKSATSTGLTAVADEINISFDADHRGLAKYDSPSSTCYRIVRGKLQTMVKEAVVEVPARFEEDLTAKSNKSNPERVFSVPFGKDDNFVGREGIIADLDHKIGKTSMDQSDSHKRAALVGLGGVGKSQIAVEYAYRVKETAPTTSVFWIHASSATRFEEDYKRIATLVDIPGRKDPSADLMNLVYEWLCNEANCLWFLIIDNADDRTVLFEPVSEDRWKCHSDFLPQRSNTSILITSRDERTAENLVSPSTRNIITVDPMTVREGVSLLETRLRTSIGESAREAAESLVQVMDCIPLAISQAGAYVFSHRTRVTISAYLDLFNRSISNQEYLLAKGDEDNNNRAVFATWQISFNYIRLSKPHSANLLALLAMFDRQGIPERLLVSEDANELEFEDALEPLTSFHLVKAHLDDRTFEMHRLVHLAIRHWLKGQNELARWEKEALSIMAIHLPFGEYKDWAVCAELLPHSTKVMEYSQSDRESALAKATVAYNTAWYLKNMSRLIEAERLIKAAQRIRTDWLGERDLLTLTSLKVLAEIMCDRGEYQEAKIQLEGVIRIEKEDFGEEHESTLWTECDLARIYDFLGEYEQAMTLMTRIVERSKEKLGPNHEDTLLHTGELAGVLHALGKLTEAEDLYRKQLSGYNDSVDVGNDHLDTSTCRNNLAVLLLNQGRFEESKPLFKEDMEWKERHLGENHAETFSSIDNMGSLLRDIGKTEEAEVYHRRALHGYERLLGKDHPDTLKSGLHLAMALYKQVKYEQAEILFRRALKLEERLGKRHPRVMVRAKWLINCLENQGMQEEADKLFEEYGFVVKNVNSEQDETEENGVINESDEDYEGDRMDNDDGTNTDDDSDVEGEDDDQNDEMEGINEEDEMEENDKTAEYDDESKRESVEVDDAGSDQVEDGCIEGDDNTDYGGVKRRRIE